MWCEKLALHLSKKQLCVVYNSITNTTSSCATKGRFLSSFKHIIVSISYHIFAKGCSNEEGEHSSVSQSHHIFVKTMGQKLGKSHIAHIYESGLAHPLEAILTKDCCPCPPRPGTLYPIPPPPPNLPSQTQIPLSQTHLM